MSSKVMKKVTVFDEKKKSSKVVKKVTAGAVDKNVIKSDEKSDSF